MQAQQKLFNKIVFTLLKVSTIAIFKCVRFQTRPLLPCFFHFPLFSFQGAALLSQVVENNGFEPLTS